MLILKEISITFCISSILFALTDKQEEVAFQMIVLTEIFLATSHL